MISVKSFSKSKNSDGTASGGGRYVSTNIANEAKKLSTTHLIWGHPFNGTQNVEGDLNVPNLTTDKTVIVGTDLKVKDNTEMVGTATIGGNTQIGGTLNVDKDVTASKNVLVNNNLTVNGSTQLNQTTINDTTNARNIIPNMNDSFTLGNQQFQWNDIFSKNAWFTNLDVTGQAHFKEVIIDKIKSAGGQVILSPANFKADKIICTYKSTDSGTDYEDGGNVLQWWNNNINSDIKQEMQDSKGINILTGVNVIRLGQFKHNKENGKEIMQEFQKGDLVLHQTFNIGDGVSSEVSNSYYRSVVLDTGIYFDFSKVGKTDYYHSDYDSEGIDTAIIDLYNQYKDQGVEAYIYIDIATSLDGIDTSGNPIENEWYAVFGGVVDVSEGDEIVCLGNNRDTARQNAIILSAYSTALDNSVVSPSIVQYVGINNFSPLGQFKYNVIAANGNSFRGNFTTDNGQSLQEIINTSTFIRKLIPLSNTAKISDGILNINLKCNVAAVQGNSVKKINPESAEWSENNSLVNPYVTDQDGNVIGTLEFADDSWIFTQQIPVDESLPESLKVILNMSVPTSTDPNNQVEIDSYTIDIDKDEAAIRLTPVNNTMILSTGNILVCNFSTYVVKQSGGEVEYIKDADIEYDVIKYNFGVKVLYGDGSTNNLTFDSTTNIWSFAKNITDFTEISSETPDLSTTAFKTARIILYKHIYDEDDTTIELDSYDVMVTTDSGAYFAVTDNIRARVQNAEDDIAEINLDAESIELNVYKNLKKTGIDIENEKITLKADKTEIEGNALNLWGDNAGMIIGDADKTSRLQFLNNTMDSYDNFGGGQKYSSIQITSSEGYGNDWEGYSDYINLGSYSENTTIKITKSVCFLDTRNSTASGSIYSYGAKIFVRQCLYKITEVDGQMVYTDYWQSDNIYSQCGSSDATPQTDVISLQVAANETCNYALRYLVHFYDWACQDGWYRAINAGFYYQPSNITSKAVIAQDGLGVINSTKSVLYFNPNRFAVKCEHISSTDQYDNSSIDMSYRHLNLYGKVNIQKKYKGFDGNSHTVYCNDFDIGIIHSGTILCLSWIGDDFLCGRTIRLYVHTTCKVGAARGQDIGQAGVGSKFVYCADGLVTRLAMQFANGDWYNDNNNGGQQLTWAAGTSYDITYINNEYIEITRVG